MKPTKTTSLNMTALADTAPEISRRQLFKATGALGGGLLLGFNLSGCSSVPSGTAADSLRPNAWLEITPQGQVLLTLDRVEMGQGTATGMTTLLAEELDIPPDTIEIVFAPVDKAYVHPEYGVQATGGSSSIRVTGPLIQQAGATGRALLVAAAADVWEVSPTTLRTEDGAVISQQGARLAYGKLVNLAASQSIPDDVQLKPPSKYRYIGKYNQRVDARPKSFGEAVYGIDVEKEDLVYAVLSRPAMIGGTISGVDTTAAKKMPGVIDVVETPFGIAVLAEQYWQARQAQESLVLESLAGEIGTPSDDDIFALYRSVIEQGDERREDGDPAGAFDQAANIISHDYELPFLAHAPLEPMNCTAWMREGRCDIWVPTQVPDIARAVAQRETGLSRADVHIHQTYIGGGFGRRLTQDYVSEAASIATHTDRPVKLIWSREEDMRHGQFRPSALHRLQVAVANDGTVIGWKHMVAVPRILDYFAKDAAGAMVPGWTPQGMVRMASKLAALTTPDESVTEGALRVPYAIPNFLVTHAQADAGIPVTYWRSVGHSHSAFAIESFVDEIAQALGRDEIELRLDWLPDEPRHRAVLLAAARKIDWKTPPPAGTYRGVALHESFYSYVAQIVELRIVDNRIKVDRVVCAVDCGRVVNPATVVAQMESGIIFGLSAALYGKIDIDQGRVRQSNFDDYPVLRMQDTPTIEVLVCRSDESSSGVGEPGTPPIAPAVANAVFKATGQRLRKLPLKLAV